MSSESLQNFLTFIEIFCFESQESNLFWQYQFVILDFLGGEMLSLNKRVHQ